MNILNILITILLLILSGLFSGLNIGLMSLNVFRLKRLVKLGNKDAKKIYPLRKNGNLLLTTILLGNVAVNATLAVFLTSLTTGVVAGIISTGLIVIFGEILPQAMFTKHAMKFGAKTYWVMWIFMVLLYPVSKPIAWSLDKILGKEVRSIFTKSELNLLIGEQQKIKNSDFDKEDVELIRRGLSFPNKIVKEHMTPKDRVLWIDKNERLTKESVDIIHSQGHSRIPVYDSEYDDVIGLLYAKDLISLDFDKDTLVHHLMRRQTEHVYETNNLDLVLDKFKNKRVHLFIVKNNKHKFVGIITLEDVIEEIIGEVYDEYDRSKMQIIPTIFSKNKTEFKERFQKVKDLSKKLQIDFMDGNFVKGKSILPSALPDLKKYSNVFEAHLMVKDPELWFERIKDKGFKKIIFHYESFSDKNKIIEFKQKIEKKKMIPVLAVNPETGISKIRELLPMFKYVQLMGIKPGKEGQKLLPTTYHKIRKISKEFPRTYIQIDGGVNKETSKKLFHAGADILNSGSYICKSKNPQKAIENLKRLV